MHISILLTLVWRGKMLPDQQATPAYERLKSIKFYWQLEWTYGWAIGDRRSMSWLWTGVSAKYFAEALTISACGLFFFSHIHIYIYLHTYMYNRECEVVLLTLVDWLITKMRKAKQCNICKLVTLTFLSSVCELSSKISKAKGDYTYLFVSTVKTKFDT